MESKHTSKSDNEGKKSCKVMTLDEKMKIPDEVHSGMNAAAAGITFHRYFIFKSNFLLIFYFNA
jgi:hypothetical protein